MKGGQNRCTLPSLKVLHWPAQLPSFRKLLHIHAHNQGEGPLLQHIHRCLEAKEVRESGCLSESDANEVNGYPDHPEKEHW